MSNPDTCPSHIDPAEWRAFLKLLAEAKYRAAETVWNANEERLKQRRTK